MTFKLQNEITTKGRTKVFSLFPSIYIIDENKYGHAETTITLHWLMFAVGLEITSIRKHDFMDL